MSGGSLRSSSSSIDNPEDLINELEILLSPAAARQTSASAGTRVQVESSSNLSQNLSGIMPSDPTGLKALFSRPSALPDEELTSNEVVVAKGDRGSKGSKELQRAYEAATKPLSPPFGVAKHFVTTSSDGETESGNLKYDHIQELFVGNVTKIENAHKRCVRYDMMLVVQIPELKDETATHPSERWEEGEGRNLFVSYSKISLEEVRLWQRDMNYYGSDADQQSSRWLYDLIYESCNTELQTLLQKKYELLPNGDRGGIVLLKLALDELMFMSRDVVIALRKYLKLFETKGLTRVKGESVLVVATELVAVCTRLNDVNQLPDETVIDVLTGLTKCSTEEFQDLFKHILNEERRVLLTQRVGSSSGQATLERIKSILDQAIDLYNTLCLGSKWHNHRHSRAAACWNCGGDDHGLGDCKKPKDEKVIAENRRKFYDKRGSGKSSDKGRGHGSDHKHGGSYSRSKWGAPKDGGVNVVDGCVKAYCKKCGWNTTHSTKYHTRWEKNPSTFVLPDTHPLSQALVKQGKKPPSSVTAPKTDASTAPSANSSITNTTLTDTVTFSRSKAKATLDEFERNSTSADTAALCGILKSLWDLN